LVSPPVTAVEIRWGLAMRDIRVPPTVQPGKRDVASVFVLASMPRVTSS
jgi:hypothetical protein